ncbi:RidA family protein [Thauera sp. SDU_THAU2]|uniref:RidA family protein n=1 Tax=Thauera sp. SDU_THAU2 TaxID=3136633 RepID=UPI00311FCCE6
MRTPEERLTALGLVLPDLAAPTDTYVPAKPAGQFLFLSGQTPHRADGELAVGKLGVDVTLDEGYRHARLCALQLIAAARASVGDLSRLTVLKVFGMVNADPGFKDHPKVINGASDLFVEVFGEKGRHARSAVGMGSLPHQVTVEVEAIFHVD